MGKKEKESSVINLVITRDGKEILKTSTAGKFKFRWEHEDGSTSWFELPLYYLQKIVLERLVKDAEITSDKKG